MDHSVAVGAATNWDTVAEVGTTVAAVVGLVVAGTAVRNIAVAAGASAAFAVDCM